ncbi:unnamed protein product [Meloidogyne enterolobii]|uniref:Uncharacterized protein n=1 Tax=Meloidogyne enterolobii TaxID=390850 RepID=A0ACB1AWE3_MELEN
MLFLSGMALVNLPLNFIPTSILVYFGYDIWQWDSVPWGNFLNFVFLTFVIDVILRGRHLTLTFIIGAISLITSAILANFHQQLGYLFKGDKRENRGNEQNI